MNQPREAAGGFVEIADHSDTTSRRFPTDERARFVEMTDHLVSSETAYLIGSGPSSGAVLDEDLTKSVCIVGAGAIRDEDLMALLRPEIVTFADTNAHFGASSFAGEFRQTLARMAVRHEFTIVTLEWLAVLLRDELPDLSDRIVGVRQGDTSWPGNHDLARNLAVRPSASILTTLMMPLAATFSKRLCLCGFEWPERDEIADSLARLGHPHPQHTRDYEDSVGAAIEQSCRFLERRGFTIETIADSSSLPLRRRRRTFRTPVEPHFATSTPVLVSLAPDWVDDADRTGLRERTIRAAATAAGYDYRSLSSRALRPSDHWVIPTFTLGSSPTAPFDTEAFEMQLGGELDRVIGRRTSVVFFNGAQVWHLAAVLRLASERPRATFVVAIRDPRNNGAADEVEVTDVALHLFNDARDAADGTNVHVFYDQPSFAGLETTSVDFAASLPVVLIDDPALRVPARIDTSPSPVQLVSPLGAANELDDGGLIVQLAERLSEELATGSLRFSARLDGCGDGEVESRLFERFAAVGGELIGGGLTERDEAALLASAHIILLTPTASPQLQASGLVLSGIAAGKPVIAARGTWVGNLVQRYGVGFTFDQDDVDSLYESVQRAILDHDEFDRRTESSREHLAYTFRPARLVTFLAGLAAAARPTPQRTRVQAVGRFAHAVATNHQNNLMRQDRERLNQLTVRDDLERSLADALDQVELLRDVYERQLRQFEQLRGHQTAASQRPPSTVPTLEPRRRVLSQRVRDHVYPRDAGAHLDELELVAELVQPERVAEGVMIDVGAHLGAAFLPFHRAEWTIYAFEPDPRHGDLLAKEYGGDNQIVLDRRAVTNTSGQRMTFYVSDESSGISGLSAFRESHVAIGDVETVALRDVLQIDRVDVLKIDTEGYEKFVLEGFPWDRLHPAVVIAEFEEAKTRPLGYTTDDLITFLVARGYQVWVSEWHPIVRYGIRHQWKMIAKRNEHCQSANSWGNLVAFRQPVSSSVMGRALSRVLTFAHQP